MLGKVRREKMERDDGHICILFVITKLNVTFKLATTLKSDSELSLEA